VIALQAKSSKLKPQYLQKKKKKKTEEIKSGNFSPFTPISSFLGNILSKYSLRFLKQRPFLIYIQLGYIIASILSGKISEHLGFSHVDIFIYNDL
jgi:hypothetical protein